MLACRAEGKTRPNPPVGAVVVRKGTAVGEGYHHRAGTPHAEIHALRRAGPKAKGATLYVTLEPCCTAGRTGPCTEAILAAGVSRVVVGVADPNPAHAGRGLRRLRRAGAEVKRGVCAPEARDLILPFATWVKSGRPMVTLKMATSLDGKIADRQGGSRWITGPASRRLVHAMRRRTDAIMVGSGTVLKDDPSLLPRGASRGECWRVVVDTAGKTPPGAQVLTDGFAARTIIATTSRCPAARLARYKASGATVWVLPRKGRGVCMSHVLRELGRLGCLHVLCEGGGELAADLAQRGLVDEYVVFTAPLLIGGRAAPTMMEGRGWLMKDAPRLKILEHVTVGKDMMIRAVPV